MSDAIGPGSVEAPAFGPDPRAPKRRRSPEHTFQAWVDRFLDRVVLPPMFTTGIDHAATDMAHIGRRSALQGRGVRFGLPDVYVCQAPRTSVWLELKRGSVVSSTQAGVHVAMERAGQDVAVCHTMLQVLLALRAAGFDLHQNANALAAEYEARVEARECAPATPRKSGRPYAAKPSASRIAAAHKAGVWAR